MNAEEMMAKTLREGHTTGATATGGDEGSDPGYARRISKAGDGPFAAKDGAHDPGGVGRGAWADGHRDLP